MKKILISLLSILALLGATACAFTKGENSEGGASSVKESVASSTVTESSLEESVEVNSEVENSSEEETESSADLSSEEDSESGWMDVEFPRP